MVLAGLFTGPEPNRRSIYEGEGSSQESDSARRRLAAMGEAPSSVTPQDAEGWFSHCGYEPQDQCS